MNDLIIASIHPLDHILYLVRGNSSINKQIYAFILRGWFWDCIFDILRYSKIIFHTARVDLRKPWALLLPTGVLLDQQSTITQAHKFGSNQSSVAAVSSSHLVLCMYNRRARLIFVLKFDTPANILIGKRRGFEFGRMKDKHTGHA